MPIRLRTTLTRKRLAGPIESIDDNQLTVIDREGGKTSVPWDSISRLDVQTGLRREVGKWTLIGAGIGLGLGLLLPLPEPDICFGESCSEPMWDREEQVAGLFVVGLLAGLISEAASNPSVPKWQRVPLPYQPPVARSFGFGPADAKRGVAVRTTFKF